MPIDLLADSTFMTWLSVFCIFSYYVVSALFVGDGDVANPKGVFPKHGLVDNLTSFMWSAWSIAMLTSLITGSKSGSLNLASLILYYVFFIFLFSICNSLLNWHFKDQFDGKETSFWRLEIQFVVMSIQTQTLLGHSRLKPNQLASELLNGLQGLVGLFFVVIFIARAVS